MPFKVSYKCEQIVSKKSAPTGYKGIPFIVGERGLPGMCSRGVL